MTRFDKDPMTRHPVVGMFRRHRLLSGAAYVLLTALPVLLSGCFRDLKQSTVHPATDTGEVIQHVYKMVTWIDTGIFILVAGLLTWAVWKFRERKSSDGKMPKQVHGNPTLEIVWTIVPAVILVFIAVPTWEGIFRGAREPGANELKVQAIGHQWWWEFDYPGLGLVTANELHIPTGRPIAIRVSSKDVIHAFWVPKLAGKMDAFPNRENLIWFDAPAVKPDPQDNVYYGQCAEFCSTSHANMRFRVIVDTEADFNAWVERTKKPQVAKTDEAKAGEQLFMEKGCPICHTINGKTQAAMADLAPNLTNLHDRTSIASALLDKTDENLTRWIKGPRDVKPGVMMCFPPQLDRTSEDCGKFPVTDDEIKKLIAFLNSPTAGATASNAPALEAVATGEKK